MARKALSALAALLRRLGVRWALMGALAANRYRASPRTTQDVDLLLSGAELDLASLESALRAAAWQVRRADPEGALLRLRHPELGIADLVIAGTDYQEQALARAREEAIGTGETAFVLAPEDVIVHKLIAGRTQDLADVEAIVAGGLPLDEDYVERWSAYWEVLERWHALRR